MTVLNIEAIFQAMMMVLNLFMASCLPDPTVLSLLCQFLVFFIFEILDFFSFQFLLFFFSMCMCYSYLN